jgi:hypothetical protein
LFTHTDPDPRDLHRGGQFITDPTGSGSYFLNFDILLKNIAGKESFDYFLKPIKTIIYSISINLLSLIK